MRILLCLVRYFSTKSDNYQKLNLHYLFFFTQPIVYKQINIYF